MNTAALTNHPVPLRQDAVVMGLVGLAHASSHFAHLLLPALFPVFVQDFGLSYAELGSLMSVFFAVSGVGQASAGFIVDRFGARRVLFVAITFFIAACLVGSVAQGYAGLLAVAVLAGLGNASFHPVDFTILNQRVSAPRLGHAFSMHGLTGNLGWAAAPVFLVGLGGLVGWRTAYVCAAAMYVLILILLVLQREKLHTEVVARSAHAKSGDLAFLKLPVVWWCFAFFMLSTMTLALVQNYAVSLLQNLYHANLEAATFTLTAYMLCGAVGVFVGGFVATRHAAHSDRVVAWCMGGGALLLALCGSGWLGASSAMTVLAVTGFAIGIGNPSRDMLIKNATPKGATGRVYGAVYSGLDVGFAIAPPMFGVLMDRGQYNAAFFVAAVVLACSVAAAAGVGRLIRLGRA